MRRGIVFRCKCNVIVRLITSPLKPSAAFLNSVILSSKSAAVLGTNIRMWDLISPPKILGAVCNKETK